MAGAALRSVQGERGKRSMNPKLTQIVLKIRNWSARHQKEFWVALILAIVSAYAVEIVKWFRSGPDSYTIYLVGALHNAQTKSVFNTFQSLADQGKLELRGVPIRAVQKDDEGDPNKTSRI